MKTFPLIIAALFAVSVCHSQTLMISPPSTMPAAPAAKEPVNYLIHVEWKEPKGDSKSLEVLTAEGSFEFDGIQKNSVKINDNDVPVTLKMNGTLNVLNDEKGRLQLFLGRTVPYVTSTHGSGPNSMSSYSQMSVGQQTSFYVTFGKPAVIQTDENGEISVLVKRLAD